MLEDSFDTFVQTDVETLANDPKIPWNIFYGKTVMITGATGLIGNQITKAFACHNRIYNANIKIKAVVRDIKKAEKIFCNITNRSYFKIIQNDLQVQLSPNCKADYIIHTACPTSSFDFVNHPVETIQAIIQGTHNILDYAHKVNVQGFVYLSSLEFYGQSSHSNMSENDIGFIDPLHVRSSYSEGKRMAECLCISFAEEYNVPIKIVRLAQTFGPGISIEDNRVFAQFAKSIINEQDIILNTEGKTERNYCYISDAISGILYVLAYGENKNAYNIANTDTYISIANMANFVCQNFGNKKNKVVFNIQNSQVKLGYAPTMKISLNTEKIQKLGWSAKTNLYEMFKKTIESLKLKYKAL